MTHESHSTRPSFWEEWSLTTKLLGIMMLLMLLVLSGTSAWVLENLKDSLIERTDERLISASQTLAKQAYQDVFQPAKLQSTDSSNSSDVSGQTPSTMDSSAREALQAMLPNGFYAQFFDTNGNPIGEPFAPEPQNRPILPKITEAQVYQRAGQPFTVSGTHSQWRARAMKVQNTDVLVTIAVPFDREIDNINERARNTMIGIGLMALALVAGVGYWAINNTFRPLRDIEKTASRIAGGDLSQRVPSFPRNTELGRLSAALNTMLGRIEDSFDGQTRSEKRIRQFVSDASHELRTPLVTIRGYAELYRQGAITKPDDIALAMERVESEAKRMGVLVDDLVVLARLDEHRKEEIGPIDLQKIVRDAAADAAAQAPDRDISFIGLDGQDARPVPLIQGSESKIRQVIVNLSGNAVRHTPESAAIEFAVGVIDDPSAVRPDPSDAEAESSTRTGGWAVARTAGARDKTAAKEKANGKDRAGAKDRTGSKDRANGKEKSRERGFVTGGVRIFRRGDSAGHDANDATKPAGIVPDVTAAGTITVDDSLRGFPNGRVRFEVRDHGEGIDPEMVPKIFERFYRLDVSRTRDTGGSGLGLSIVKAIVENHHGAISVHETPGGGATFRVDLPIPENDNASADARKDER